jgi:hypothetical protein
MVIVLRVKSSNLQYSKTQMMFPKLYNAAFIAATLLISCGGGNDNDYIDKSLITPAAEKKAVDTVLPAAQTINNQPVAGNTSMPVTMTPATNSIQINPQATNAKLNPAHGQPGHRCDIAVGAPLDSKPAQITTQQPTTVSTPQPVAQPTAPGMNPPHGQPGHRCDIAVGAPLDSKPIAPPVVSVDSAAAKSIKPDTAKNK